MYKQKKKRYPDLMSLYKEMLASKPKIRSLSYDGVSITHKYKRKGIEHILEYGMCDGVISVEDLTNESKSV